MMHFLYTAARRGRSHVPAFLLVLCFSLSAAHAQTTTTVGPTADATVQDGSSANTNFGTHTTILVKKNATAGANRWAYLKFPLSGTGGTITKAVLRLYGKNATAGYSGTDTVSGVADTTWTETGLTWNNKPAPSSALSSATVTGTAQYVQWDVTPFVQAQQSAGATAVALVATMDAVPAGSQADSFNARESAASQPQLVLTSSSASMSPNATASPATLYYFKPQNTGATTAQTVTIANTGTVSFTIPASGITLTGANASLFSLTSKPTLPATVAAGKSVTVQAVFNPTVKGVYGAQLNVATSDPAHPSLAVTLRGLSSLGTGGGKEASLQWILDFFQIPVNVGSPDPTVDAMPSTSPLGDEVLVPYFQKAGTGTVSIKMLAGFGPADTASGLNQRFGWYNAGSASSLHQLFTIANAYAQTILQPISGSSTFDPGTANFGIYTQWPYRSNNVCYQEDPLNTFTGSSGHYLRVYIDKDPSGNVIPNTFVMASGDASTGPDYNDSVFVISNVRPAVGVVTLQNLDILPYSDRFIFNRIQTPVSADQHFHDTATLRVKNVGLAPVTVTALSVSGPWTLPNAAALPATVAAGGALDVPMQFVATSGRVTAGSLSVQTDIPAQATLHITLEGFWQDVSEHGEEPRFSEILNSLYGYQTDIGFTGTYLPKNQGGDLKAVGDEVLSPYWVQANAALPVSVQQMNGFHTYSPPTKNSTLYWFKLSDKASIQASANAVPPVKSTLLTTVMIQNPYDSQSLLPRLQGSTLLATATFNPGVPFGMDIDYWYKKNYVGENTDADLTDHKGDLKNGCTEPCGHHVRFYPLKGRDGVVVPNTYIMTMDYEAGNYDFQDVTYLISNITPASP